MATINWCHWVCQPHDGIVAIMQSTRLVSRTFRPAETGIVFGNNGRDATLWMIRHRRPQLICRRVDGRILPALQKFIAVNFNGVSLFIPHGTRGLLSVDGFEVTPGWEWPMPGDPPATVLLKRRPALIAPHML